MVLYTICDFHNFGLIFAGQMHYLPQRILVFEVIVQPHGNIFLTFSSETKIMKITHSAPSFPFFPKSPAPLTFDNLLTLLNYIK